MEEIEAMAAEQAAVAWSVWTLLKAFQPKN
jgi:hypothetical protein